MDTNILLLNASSNENGNTVQMAKQLLNTQPCTQLNLVDYKIYPLGHHFKDDQFEEVYKAMCNANTIIMGIPVYWYSIAGPLQILLDRLYEKIENNKLAGKDLYFVIQ